jgi:ABC-type antimicrobial peptide transport system permease subunit
LQSEEAAGARVVVLSHALWQTQFGGDRGIVGRTITLDRQTYTVIGVAPAGFAFPVNEPNIQFWTTIAADRAVPPGDTPMTEQRGAHMLRALGRLKHGVSVEQARADLNVIAVALAKQYPDSNTNDPQASVRPELETLVGESRTPLLILLGAVGVVGSAKLFAMDAEPQPTYYFPYKQLAWMPPPVMLRATIPPRMLESAVRKEMAALDPLVPVFQITTMEEMLSTQVTEPRFHTVLLACFAGVALLLTMVGLYGVMAYSVTRRTREIGLRIALGASRSTVLAMVLRQALVLLAVGLALGLAASLAADRLLQSMLFGVSSLNPAVLSLSGLLVALTGLLAAYLPARRAARVDPMVALRYE